MIKIDDSKKGIITRVIIFLLIIMMALPFLVNTVNANGFGEGEGDDPTNSGYGYWHVAEGPNAWNTFKSIQSSLRNWTRLLNWINNNSLGYQYPDGSRESMEDTCKRSEFIWWYGRDDGRMYTQGRGLNNVPQSNWKPMSNKAKISLEVYKNWSDLWSGGQVVIICSATYEEPTEPTIPVKIVAKSGTFQYDGSYKTVEGIDYNKSDLSKLKSGHTAKATIIRREKEVGAYPVEVKNARIVDGSNRDVSEQYGISKQDGVLTITPPDPPDIDYGSGKGLEQTDVWRCVDFRSDSAKAYTFNTTSGSHGFTPSGAPGLNSTYGERWTPAGNFANRNSVPGPGDSLSSWNSWKSSFQGGSDTVTPDLNLQSAGVSDVLSKYGGVYNIARSLREDTYNSTNCQPQTRHLEKKTGWSSYTVCRSTPDGGRSCSTRRYSYTYYEWTPWKNSGGRIVWSSSGPSSKTDRYNYQILSVNYNRDGFNSVRNSVGGTVLSLANGDAGAVLQTPERSGAGPGPLGRGSHVTAKSSFYNDGDSLRKAYICTVAPNSSASNDANNNQGNAHLFTEYNESAEPGKKYGLPNDEGQLVFFRDNNDRQVRADVWYPRPTGKSDLESYSGNPAKRTWAKIYNNPNPTPEIELTKIAPWNDKNNTIRFVNSEKVYKGNHNKFLIKSQWTSDEGKPYQVGLNWEYKATGYNIVPRIVDGYKVKSMTGVYSYDFDVYCDFKNATGDYQANVPRTPFVDGTTGRIWSTNDAIRTLFTRSVSDMTN
jgi:hypothetical protein